MPIVKLCPDHAPNSMCGPPRRWQSNNEPAFRLMRKLHELLTAGCDLGDGGLVGQVQAQVLGARAKVQRAAGDGHDVGPLVPVLQHLQQRAPLDPACTNGGRIALGARIRLAAVFMHACACRRCRHWSRRQAEKMFYVCGA